MTLKIGVDGCRNGWVAVMEEESRVMAVFVGDIGGWLKSLKRDVRIFIDMPIGLPDGPHPRACDGLARKRLGKRACTIFSVPARSVLKASDYRDACDCNRLHLGKGLSKQSWAIVPKIAELDGALDGVPHLRDRIFEAHPELAFSGLGGAEVIRHSKRSEAGACLRKAVLMEKVGFPDPASLLRSLPGEVQQDDLLDAMALCALAGKDPSRIHTLPDPPEQDDTGKPMGIAVLD